MRIVQHRINDVNELRAIEPDIGCEIDIRSDIEGLYLMHDPPYYSDNSFNRVSLEEWLGKFNDRGLLILNVKEEGLHQEIKRLIKKYRVSEYFILDESFPYIYKNYSKYGLEYAIRVSEFESVNTVIKFNSYLQEHSKISCWCWIDTFTLEPLPVREYKRLTDLGIKICIVSPELQMERFSLQEKYEKLSFFKNFFKENKISIDAVCTKFVDDWR